MSQKVPHLLQIGSETININNVLRFSDGLTSSDLNCITILFSDGSSFDIEGEEADSLRAWLSLHSRGLEKLRFPSVRF